MRAREFLLSLALALVSLWPGTAMAQAGLMFPIEDLEGWTMGQSDGQNARILEFVPPGQTFEAWSEMVTIMVIDTRRARPRPTGLSLYQNMTDGYRNACGQTRFTEPTSAVVDGLTTTTFSMACDVARDGPTAGSGDFTYVKIIEAPPGNIYMAQRAWRGALPDPSVRPITDEQFAAWMTFFDGVRVGSR
jgi:hypothetical protein